MPAVQGSLASAATTYAGISEMRERRNNISEIEMNEGL
jgi:hypothetical protein